MCRVSRPGPVRGNSGAGLPIAVAGVPSPRPLRDDASVGTRRVVPSSGTDGGHLIAALCRRRGRPARWHGRVHPDGRRRQDL